MLYRVGVFELDDERFEMTREGQRLQVAPKVLELLFLLIESRNRLVSRAEMVERLWPDVVVSEASIATLVKDARQLLGDDGRTQRWIMTVRGKGLRWVAPVETSERRRPEGRGEYHTDGFVGRTSELTFLRSMLDQENRGRTLVLLLGEAGIGKTRLLRELVAGARSSGHAVVVAQYDAPEGAPAYRPWRQIMRTMSNDARRPPPWSEDEKAPALTTSSRFRAEARFRLFEDVADYVRACAADRRWLLCLEDLHLAEPFALALTRFVAGQLAASGVLLVGTWRSPEIGTPESHLRWLDEIALQPFSSTLDIRGLPATDTATLVTQMFPAAPPAFVEKLHAESGGNPFIIEEIVRDALREGADVVGAGPSASGFDEMLRARLARAGTAAHWLLTSASILGQEFPLAFAEVISGLPAAECAEAWDTLEKGGFIRRVRGRDDRLAFAHGLVRSALETRLSVADRLTLHGRAADVIERSAPLSRYEWATQLAFHLRRAVPGVDLERAVDHSLTAARMAASRSAFDDAARHFEGTLAVLARTDGDPIERRCRIHIELGEAQLGAAEYRASRATFLEAVRLARLAGSGELLADAALGLGRPFEHLLQPFVDAVLVDALREALATTDPKNVALRARLLGRLSIALQTAEASPEARALAEEAVTLARKTEEADLVGYALLARAWSVWDSAAWSETLACTEELVAVDRTDGHLGAWYSLLHAGSLIAFGRIDAARSELREQRERVARTRLPYARAFVAMLEALIALVDGASEGCERAIAEWFAILAEVGDEPLIQLVHLSQLWPLRMQQGRIAELLPSVEQAFAYWPSIATRSMLAAVLRANGRFLDAQRHYDAACADIDMLARDRVSFAPAFSVLPAIAFELGDAAGGRRLEAAFARTEAPHVVVAAGYYGVAAHHRALLAAAQGDVERALSLLDDARDLTEAIGARFWQDRVRRDRTTIRRRCRVISAGCSRTPCSRRQAGAQSLPAV